MDINLITLAFRDRGLEQEFLSDYEQHYRQTSRTALVAGILLVALFGILDLYLYPLIHTKLWLIRYGMVIPVLLISAIYLYRPGPRIGTQPVLALATLVAGMGVVAMTVFIPDQKHLLCGADHRSDVCLYVFAHAFCLGRHFQLAGGTGL
jgi:hypothetical protein